MRFLIGLAALLLVPRLAMAQLKCCYQVTSIDAKTGLISANQPSTGASLQFQVRNRLLLAKVRLNQQVFADLVARQVGFDARQACCTVYGTPVTPARPAPGASAPAATSTPTAAKGAGTVPAAIAFTPTMPTIGYGTPYKPTSVRAAPRSRVQSRSVTSFLNGRNQAATILQLRGRKGIEEATGLSPGARTLLAMHVRTLSQGEPATYLVNTQLADDWIKAHPVPASMKPVEPPSGGDSGDDCNGMVSINCAQQAVEQAGDVLEQAWDMTVDEFERFQHRAIDAWNKGAADLADAWATTQACFSEKTLSLPNIPVKFDITPAMTVDLEQSNSKGSASGTVKGSVTVGIPMKADFAAQLDLFYIPCLPFAVRPKALSADGMMTVGEALDATVTATGKFTKTFTIPPSGGPVIPIQVFPIVIAGVPVSEIDVSAYIEGNIEVSATGQADGRFQVQSSNPTKFNFSCSGSGCKAASKGAPAPTTTSQSAQIEGQVSVKPAIYTALQLNFNYQALSARAGPQPYLLGIGSGCGAISATQTAGGAATTDVNHALTGDIDWGVELRAEALVLREFVGPRYTLSLMKDRHLWFRDLAPGGSTALVPVIASPAQAVATQPATYKVKMPTCYPYPDRVQYQVSWTGNATPAAAPGCSWQAGRGTCSYDPTKDLVISLTWPAAGPQSITVQATGDVHLRTFAPAPPPAQVAVTVTASP